MEGGGYMRKQDTLLLMIAVSGEMPADLAEHIIGSVSYDKAGRCVDAWNTSTGVWGFHFT